MKKILLIMMFVTALFSQEEWFTNYNKAISSAKETGKPIYIFEEMIGCPHCVEFKTTTLKDKEIIKSLKRDFVLLKFTYDKSNIPTYLESDYFPAHFVIDSNEEIITETTGFKTIEMFSVLMEDALMIADILKEED